MKGVKRRRVRVLTSVSWTPGMPERLAAVAARLKTNRSALVRAACEAVLSKYEAAPAEPEPVECGSGGGG